jgi:hypothetical protein
MQMAVHVSRSFNTNCILSSHQGTIIPYIVGGMASMEILRGMKRNTLGLPYRRV